MLFGNSSDISTDLFAEDCVTVLLVSMLGAGVDSFCLAVEDWVLLVVEVAVVFGVEVGVEVAVVVGVVVTVGVFWIL